jgi:hypothetical protein
MPRSHRRRPEPVDDSLDRLLAGWRRTETRRGAEWSVQPVSAPKAVKEYTCPGCGRVITPGTAHVVAWRADGVLGDDAALADRRHWHTACWRIG